MTVGVTKHKSQITFDLSGESLHQPEMAANVESPPPLLAYSFLSAIIRLSDLQLPGSMANSDLLPTIDPESFPKLVIPPSQIPNMEEGIVYVTMAAF